MTVKASNDTELGLGNTGQYTMQLCDVIFKPILSHYDLILFKGTAKKHDKAPPTAGTIRTTTTEQSAVEFDSNAAHVLPPIRH